MEISVIIPTYYRHKDLSELLESILTQTVNPAEIVIVDDTPDESILTIYKEYKLNFNKLKINFKYIRNFKEKGITIARNIGIDNVHSDIVLFLDSDVVLYPNYIDNILNIFYNYSNALGVQGWMIPKAKNKDIMYYVSQLFLKLFYLPYDTHNVCIFNGYPVILSKIINCTCLSGSNMAYKKIVFNEFRFDEYLTKYALMEDKLFSHSILQKYPNSLFISPYAKLIHKYSEEGRLGIDESENTNNFSIKYCLIKLFGVKGLIKYYRQAIGLSIIKKYKRLIINARARNHITKPNLLSHLG